MSVIAMTLNQERFVEGGLRSIANQKYRDIEVIVTDDGSTDGTAAIIDEWIDDSDVPVSLIRHDQPHGICSTLNEAIGRASGEFVASVSLDDIWYPDRLTRHVEAFERSSDRFAVVYGDCEVIDDAGRIIEPSYLAAYTPYGNPEGPPAPSGDVFIDMVRGNFIATPAVTVRRSAIEHVGGYDPDIPFEDWPMWLRLSSEFAFIFDGHIAGGYRIHEGGYWSKIKKDPSIRAYLFRCLLRVHGVRAHVDPVILRRLSILVDEMIENDDPTAAVCQAQLAAIRSPNVVSIVDPGCGGENQVASLVADGHTITEADSEKVTVVSEPSGILYLAPWMVVGGADKATLEWFRHIDRYSFRRYLVTTLRSDNAFFNQCDVLADEAWCLPEIVDQQEFPQFIIEFIASRRIDVVHIMNSKLGFDMIPAIKLAFPRISVVVQLHSEAADGSGYPRYVVARYDNLISAYSVISNDLKRRLVDHHVSPDKIETIYLGVDAFEEFNPTREGVEVPEVDPSRFHVLFPARLSREKRPFMMLDIAARARLLLPNIQFHVVGDGELRLPLEQRRDELGLEEVVQFHGSSDNMWGWYTACQVSLLCSEFEGIPLVLFETMSMRTPMVAPLVGAIGELLDDQTGFGVPEDADPAVYAEAIVELARDPARRKRMGNASRQRIRAGYQLDDMGRQHRELYGRLIARAAVKP